MLCNALLHPIAVEGLEKDQLVIFIRDIVETVVKDRFERVETSLIIIIVSIAQLSLLVCNLIALTSALIKISSLEN